MDREFIVQRMKKEVARRRKRGMKLGNCWCEASVCRAKGVKIAEMCNLCCYTVGVEGQRRSWLVPLSSLLPPKLHAATAGGKMAS